MSLRALSVLVSVGLAASAASASTVTYSTGFEPTAFSPGNINGQSGWTQTNPAYLGNVDTAAARTGVHGFRRANTFGQGSFSDQTLSPSLGVGVGEPTALGATPGYDRFEASFWFRSVSASADGSVIGVAPTDFGGSRAMSIGLRNEAADAGVRLQAFTAANAGPLGASTSFIPVVNTIVARNTWHRIDLAIDFLPGPANDVVSFSLNGSLLATFGSWEDYYRYDNEQSGNGNNLQAIDRLLFRSSTSVSTAQGFDFDDVTYSAVPAPGAAGLLGLAALGAARRRRRN